ncbi:MAG: hypothetical protein NT027_15930 [Proteobacteria bacterium]|nr:hypothetical protein [Pseudomonadota bacterium]
MIEYWFSQQRDWLIAYSLTCVIELPVYLFMLRHLMNSRMIVIGCLLSNTMTHPIFWFLLPDFESLMSNVLAEVGVVAIECLVFVFIRQIVLRRKFGTKEITASAIVANTLSLVVGLLCDRFLLVSV